MTRKSKKLEAAAIELLRTAIAKGQYVGPATTKKNKVGDGEAAAWLEGEGYITREHDPNNGTWRLHPTSAGRQAVRRTGDAAS